MAGTPLTPALAARTDQVLAMAKDMAARLGPEAVAVAGLVAELLAAEFPGQEAAAGRIILAAAATAVAVERETGVDPVNCMVLAAVRLTREADSET
jgi:hypothetical protein